MMLLWLGGAVFLLSAIALWLAEHRRLQRAAQLLEEAAAANAATITSARDARRLQHLAEDRLAEAQRILEEAARLRREAIQAHERSLLAAGWIH